MVTRESLLEVLKNIHHLGFGINAQGVAREKARLFAGQSERHSILVIRSFQDRYAVIGTGPPVDALDIATFSFLASSVKVSDRV
jgi:hypothetical protein